MILQHKETKLSQDESSSWIYYMVNTHLIFAIIHEYVWIFLFTHYPIVDAFMYVTETHTIWNVILTWYMCLTISIWVSKVCIYLIGLFYIWSIQSKLVTFDIWIRYQSWMINPNSSDDPNKDGIYRWKTFHHFIWHIDIIQIMIIILNIDIHSFHLLLLCNHVDIYNFHNSYVTHTLSDAIYFLTLHLL